MSQGAEWADLLARLESDLRSRYEGEASRDSLAWQELRRRVRVYAARPVAWRLSAEDIEDVVQSVMLKLQSRQTLQRIRLAGSPAGYLAVMVRNASRDVIRLRRREEHALSRMEEGQSAAMGTDTDDESVTLVRRLRAELRQLSVEERALLKMRFWSEMSLGEIARETGLAYSATAVKMFRLLRRLRERLGADC